jgi:hypothetical protein
LNFFDVQNAELFTLTYGALVVQLLKDSGDDVDHVNQELHRMGYNIGVRLIDEFLVQSSVSSCMNFQETAEVISKIGLKMFLGITAEVSSWADEGKTFRLRLPRANNPFIDFVELPAKYARLTYGNLLCGVIRGALEMVQLGVDCVFVSDVLKGDENSEIEVTLREVIQARLEKED